MFEYNQSKNQMVLKTNRIFLAIGIVAAFMAISGIRLISGLLPFEEKYTFADVFGLIFICVWTIIVSGMGIFAFTTNSKQVLIDDDGILCNTWFVKKKLKWAEVKDWGTFLLRTNQRERQYILFVLLERTVPYEK